MHKIVVFALALCGLLVIVAAPAAAEPMRIEALLTPKEQMGFDFADGSNHFVLLVWRVGAAEGTGPLAGTTAAEYGMHDVIPGVSGEPHGYLEFTAAEGDKAYVKWLVRAIFVPGPEGKPRLLNYGLWELVGGTGKYAGMKGIGTLRIEIAGATERRYVLEGDLIPAS